jgi:serine/threonine protein kinase
MASKYNILKTIGEGAFSKVKLAKFIETGEEVAIKVIRKKGLNETSVKKEVAIMRSCKHSHIIKYIDMIQDINNYYIIMEYVDGKDLFSVVMDNGPIPERRAKKYFAQIVSAVSYCHSQFITHRDLKPENIMVDTSDSIKIIDFGLSTQISINAGAHYSWCGSPMYVPPEIYLRLSYMPQKVDIWCLGIILYAMLSNFLPFGGEGEDLAAKVAKCEYKIPEVIPERAASLIKKILRRDPTKRITLQGIREHRWIRKTLMNLQIPASQYDRATSIDLGIIDRMESIGFDGDEAMKAIRHDHRNEYTSVYYYLLDRVGAQYVDEIGGTPTLARLAKTTKSNDGQKLLEKLPPQV